MENGLLYLLPVTIGIAVVWKVISDWLIEHTTHESKKDKKKKREHNQEQWSE